MICRAGIAESTGARQPKVREAGIILEGHESLAFGVVPSDEDCLCSASRRGYGVDVDGVGRLGHPVIRAHAPS